jgi:hypothetical protein
MSPLGSIQQVPQDFQDRFWQVMVFEIDNPWITQASVEDDCETYNNLDGLCSKSILRQSQIMVFFTCAPISLCVWIH